MKRHIFIVDDIIENLIVLSDLLEQKGTKITTASSGKEALKTIPIENPDIILLDLFMPEMNGFEVCRKLKANKKTAEIPVIFLTDGQDIENLEKGYDIGAIDYIIKPCNSKELIKRINAHIKLEKTFKLLKKSLQIKGGIITAFTDAVYICSPDNKITYLNDAMIDLIGYNAEGEFCYKAIHKSNKKCKWCIYDILKDKKEITYKFFYERKKKYFISKNIILFDKLKFSTLTDITERKLSEDAILDANIALEQKVTERTEQLSKFNEELLREIDSHQHTMRLLQESEYLLKEAQKIAKLGHWHLNLLENKLLWSDEVYRIFEIDPANFKATYEAFLNLVHPEDREYVNKSYMDSVNNKTIYNINHRILLKNGEIKYVNERCKNEYNKKGETISSTGIVVDITLQEKIEQRVLNIKHFAEEKERSRIAEDLHDEVFPLLAAVKLFTQSLRKQTDLNEKAKIHTQIENTINDAIKSVSEISNNLSPHILLNFGLSNAIEHYIRIVSKINKAKIGFTHNLRNRIDENVEIAVYRITIELINNGLKHSNASKLFISINKESNLKLIYNDNGTGFDFKKVIKEKKGMGLFNIIKRIEALDGNIVFTIDNGLNIKIVIPLTQIIIEY